MRDHEKTCRVLDRRKGVCTARYRLVFNSVRDNRCISIRTHRARVKYTFTAVNDDKVSRFANAINESRLTSLANAINPARHRHQPKWICLSGNQTHNSTRRINNSKVLRLQKMSSYFAQQTRENVSTTILIVPNISDNQMFLNVT